MDFSLNEEQQMLKKAARDFLEKECPESFVRKMEASNIGYSPFLWRKIAELGWLGIMIPEKYGGLGGSILDTTVLYEEMGRAIFPGPHLSTILCGIIIQNSANEQQKKQLLPKVINGELIPAFALTEPSASWDASGISVRATTEGDGFVINGTKLFVNDAHIADHILCAVKTRDCEVPEHGITLFLVDTKSSGIRISPLKTTAGDKQCEVIFNNVKVPCSDIVGEVNRGWDSVIKALQNGSVLLCAQMVGAGQKILELTLDYAKTRVQFDEPIGIYQYVQEHCVNIFARVEASRSVTYQAAWYLSEDLPSDIEVAVAKSWTGDAMEYLCWYAHQVFGGVGYTVDHGLLPLFTRRCKAAQLYLGDSKYHRKKISEQFDTWDYAMPKGLPLGLWEEIEPRAWP